MAKSDTIELFRRFSFTAHVGGELLPISAIEHTPDGLILMTVHSPDRVDLGYRFIEVPPQTRLTVRMLTLDRKRERVIEYELGTNARHLAVSVDQCSDGPAYDRILFPQARVVAVSDPAPK